MGCRDERGQPQLSVAFDRSSGRVEEAWNRPNAGPGLHPFLVSRAASLGIDRGRADHLPVLAVSAHLWNRGFEDPTTVLPDLVVDTYRVNTDGLPQETTLCDTCVALLAGVDLDTRGPRPIVEPEHVRAIAAAMAVVRNGDAEKWIARYAEGETEDPCTPYELRMIVNEVETARSGTAMVLTARDVSLTSEDALAALLANPPAALWPGTPAQHGGGFLAWPECAGVDELSEVDLSTARAVLATAIGYDLAYDDERVSPERSIELADKILAFAGSTMRWWTNSGDVRAPGEGNGRRGVLGSWTPLTTATFDTGVIGVDQDRILVAWLMDED